jgi:pimeloyl-ACP methyl ester carboxylesterase
MRYPPPGRLVDVGGFRLHIHAMGQAPPVVVFDAALGASSIMGAFRGRRFARGDATVPDLLERGRLLREPLAHRGRVAHAARLAGEQPLFVLVGHSYGLVMQIFAQRYPRDTAGLVLVDPAQAADWVRPAPKEQERIDRGVRLCRYGARAARVGIARVVSALVGAGALTPAWAVTKWFTRGELSVADDWVLSPVLKLPPESRGPLRHIWTQAKFFEALGSQIEMMPASSAETLEASRGGFGDIPIVTISAGGSDDYRLGQHDAFAALSTRGRHIAATHASHWVPLDDPDLIVAAIRSVVDNVLQCVT